MKEYDEGRIWYKQKGKTVTVGLTEKGLLEIGKIQGLSLPVEGDECFQDDVVGEIEGEKTAFEIIAPLDGVISMTNESITDDMDTLESDPLDEGWLYKIKATENDEENEDDGDSDSEDE